MRMMKNLATLGLASAMLASSPVPARAGIVYSVVELGNLGGPPTSNGYSVNDSGQVAGYSAIPGDNPNNQTLHAFLSGINGGPLKDLGTLGGSTSIGYGVNDSGQVTGYSFGAGLTAPQHAFLSGANGGPLKDLGTLGGADSLGRGVNASGQVTGDSQIAGNADTHAFLSGANGGPLKDLGTLPGGLNSSGSGVNASGQVAGVSDTTFASHAFLSGANGGALKDLGTLGGADSAGFGVNASGQVTGNSSLAGNADTHAFLSGANGGALKDLGTLGGTYSAGYGINDSGQVTGYSSLAGGGVHAFLYSDGQMMDLNNLIDPSLGITLGDAYSISDTGYILALGGDSNDSSLALLLIPSTVPEPSSLVLVALGLAGAAVARRRASGRAAA